MTDCRIRPIALSLMLSACGAADSTETPITETATGRTKNVVWLVSQGPDAVRGEKDGTPPTTLLEYAEERGLATGVVSNSSMADATPAACYAHTNDRNKKGEIFAQVVKPRFGDGVDVIIGPGRRESLGLVKVEDSHTAEEVPVTATGPGSEQVRGVFPNTRIFHIMKDAHGW